MWPNHAGAHFHDPRLQGGVSGRHLPRDSHHHTPGALRNVLRLRHFRHLRAREERHPASTGKFLPHVASQRSHLAHRGYADDPKVHLDVPTADLGHHVPQVHDDQGMVHGRVGRVLWIHLHDSMDSAVPDDKFDSAKTQARLKFLGVFLIVRETVLHLDDLYPFLHQ